MIERGTNRRRIRSAAVAVLTAAGALALVGAGSASAVLPPAQSTEAVCAEVEEGSGGFTDIGNNPAHDANIECLVAAGITRGKGTGTTYDPDGPVSRAQMASFIARAIDEANALELVALPDLPPAGADRFNDDTGSPHEGSINRLAAAGIVNGVSPTGFAPDRDVSRAQMATFINNAQRFLTSDQGEFFATEDYFVDDNTNVHQENINALAAFGIVQGVDGTRYVPDAPVSRAQMATFVMRYYGALEANDAISPVQSDGTTPPPASNATLSFGPTEARSVVAAVEPSGTDDTTYTATGLTAGQAYRVTLVEAALVSAAPGPVYTFTEDGDTGFASAGSVGEARITTVNGATVPDTQSAGGITPVDGEITVVVDAVGFTHLFPVIYTDEGDAQTRLNLDDQNKPTEPFGVAGVLQVIPPEAESTTLGGALDVLLADEANDRIVAGDGASESTFLYDTNDTFFVGSTAPANEVTPAGFEAVLNRGDQLAAGTIYKAEADLSSTFIIANVSPQPPKAILSSVGESTAVIRVNELLLGATANVYLGANGESFAQSDLEVSTSEDADPAAPGFQVRLTGLTEDTSYEFYVTQTDDGEESDPEFTTAQAGTDLTTTPAAPPALTGAAFGGGARPSDKVVLDFSEPVTLADGGAAKVVVTCRTPDIIPILLPGTTTTRAGTSAVQTDGDTLTVTLTAVMPADTGTCGVSVGAGAVTDGEGTANEATNRGLA